MKAATFLACLAMSFSSCLPAASAKDVTGRIPEAEDFNTGNAKEFYDRIPESENVSPTHFKEFYDRILEQPGGDVGAGLTDNLPGDGMGDSGPGAEYQMQPVEGQ